MGNSPERAAGRSGRRIIQVVVNLISNAAKFSRCGNTMRVRLADGNFPDGGEALYCSVSDNGTGIPENELEAVFGLFVQSSEAKTNAGGTSLGLAIGREDRGSPWRENLGGEPKAWQMHPQLRDSKKRGPASRLACGANGAL